MKTALVLLVMLSSGSLLAREKPKPAPIQDSRAVFSEFLNREKSDKSKDVRLNEDSKRLTMQLLGDVVKKIDTIPSQLLAVDEWDLSFSFPKRQDSADLWVSMCDIQYRTLSRELLARYDRTRKKAKPEDHEKIFNAYLLSQAVVAAQFRRDFLAGYARHYRQIDMSAFEEKISKSE
jgi:hypothetical protein